LTRISSGILQEADAAVLIRHILRLGDELVIGGVGIAGIILRRVGRERSRRWWRRDNRPTRRTRTPANPGFFMAMLDQRVEILSCDA